MIGGAPTRSPMALKASKDGHIKKFPPVIVSRMNLYQVVCPHKNCEEEQQ
jgi:hypothetical protein